MLTFTFIWVVFIVAPRFAVTNYLSSNEPRASHANVTEICVKLSQINANQTILQTSQNYDAIREAHWSQTAWKHPGCIFLPETPTSVLFVLSVLLKNEIPFAVRGGGHNPNPGWANIDTEGVLISMTGIDELAYDEAIQTVRVGAGNTWGQVYEYLEPLGRMVVGARAETVGFGYFGGGGLSHLSNLYGFGGDNVVSFEVILANLTIVTASAISHPDLFWALKGGGNNYGIITQATLRTYQLGKVWGGVVLYPGAQRDAFMSALVTYQSSGQQQDPKSAMGTYVIVSNDTILLQLAYLDDVSTRPTAFAQFYNLTPIVDTTGPQATFSDLLKLPPTGAEPLRYDSVSTTLFNDPAAYIAIAQICQNATSALTGINGATMFVVPQPISKSMVTESLKRGGSPVAEGLDKKEQLWLTILMGYNLASDDARIASFLQDILHQVEKYTKSRGIYHPFVFLNEAGKTQDSLRGYGASVFGRLKQVARVYDPKGVFRKQMPGGFKL